MATERWAGRHRSCPDRMIGVDHLMAVVARTVNLWLWSGTSAKFISTIASHSLRLPSPSGGRRLITDALAQRRISPAALLQTSEGYDLDLTVSVAVTYSNGGQFATHVKAPSGNPYDRLTLAAVIPDMHALVGSRFDRIVVDKSDHGYHASPDRMLRGFIFG